MGEKMDRSNQRVMSLHLSRVMDDIGVSRYIIARRRRTWLVSETLLKLSHTEAGKGRTYFHFGSQSEGNTTHGLQSDIDTLFCNNSVPVILNLSDWTDGISHLLVIKNKQIPPQHCWLQWVRRDLPLPLTQVKRPSVVVYHQGRILHPNTQMTYCQYIREFNKLGEVVYHGPSKSYDENDVVMAYHCASIPYECQFLFNRHRPGHWPSVDTLARARQTGVFLVPQGYTESPSRPSRCRSTALHVLIDDPYYPQSKWQWRFSTSLMERLLMFDMNITQHKTYVFLKVIRKTFFKPVVADRLSTFHIKTAMLFTIETFPPEIWRDDNLVQCVIYCLTTLLRWLKLNYCPHYTISGVNLFTGKLFKHEQIVIENIILKMISDNISCAFSINMDNIGRRLSSYGNYANLPPVETRRTDNEQISTQLIDEYINSLQSYNNKILDENDKDKYIMLLIEQITMSERKYDQVTSIEQETALLIRPHLYGMIAFVLASRFIYLRQPIPQNILNIYEISFDSDLLSSRLKFASTLYCSGQYEAAANCLTYCEGLLGPAVWQYCVCEGRIHQRPSREFKKKGSNKSNKDMLKCYAAMCVFFSRYEIYCVPEFLLYEMFRTVGDEDRQQRRPAISYKWMDCIVIDSVPFLHYLQYLTYSHLNIPHRNQAALHNLRHYTLKKSEAHGHVDTSLNMLGHCYELENRLDLAWICYTRSLNIYRRNNAAKWHVARLLNRDV